MGAISTSTAVQFWIWTRHHGVAYQGHCWALTPEAFAAESAGFDRIALLGASPEADGSSCFCACGPFLVGDTRWDWGGQVKAWRTPPSDATLQYARTWTDGFDFCARQAISVRYGAAPTLEDCSCTQNGDPAWFGTDGCRAVPSDLQ